MTAHDGRRRDARLGALLGLLRDHAAGEGVAVPETGVVETLALAERLDVLAPACAALETVLPPPAAAMLTRPALNAADAAAADRGRQMTRIAGILAAEGLEAVALKGAAFLAEAPEAPPAWRGMIDLDLLLPRGALPAAVSALGAAGYRGEDAAHVSTDYHYPALLPEDDGLAVELHVDLGWLDVALFEGMRGRAVASPLAGLRLPHPDDRLAHLVHHAQIADGGFDARLAGLRDALDWRHLTADAGADPAAVRTRFARHGLAAPFDAFAAFAAAVWRDVPEGPPQARRWAEDALDALADPALARRRRRTAGLRRGLGTLTHPRLLAHALVGASNPIRLRRFLRGLMARARNA